MARPKSADPDATRARMLAAAREITIRDGMRALSARTIAQGAGVSASTVSSIRHGVAGVRMMLIQTVFKAMINPSEHLAVGCIQDVFELAVAPLRADDTLARLANQITGVAGGHQGIDRDLAAAFDRSWTIVQENLVKVEIEQTALRDLGDFANTADRIISHFFSAALHLSRNPNLNNTQLRMLMSSTVTTGRAQD